MLHPSLEERGGVVSFCQILMKTIDPSFQMDDFTIGNRPGNRNQIRRMSFFLNDVLNLKRRLMRRDRYDVIHLNPSFKIFALIRDSFYLLLIDRFSPGKAIVIFHGWDENLTKSIIQISFLRKCFQRIYKKASFILVLSSPFKRQLVEIGIPPDKVGIITTMYEGWELPARPPKKRTDDKTRILFMARLVKAKGVYTAAEVGRILVEKGYKRFKFMIAGDGPELERIKKYIKKNALEDYIEALGYITGEKKREILEESDIFLFPSQSEGCPVVILEAIGAGLAVVSTPVGAIPEIVENEINGLIIGGNDPRAFFEAIKKLIENKELLKKMQQLNKEKAEALYEAKIVTRKIESHYRLIMGQKKNASFPTPG